MSDGGAVGDGGAGAAEPAGDAVAARRPDTPMGRVRRKLGPAVVAARRVDAHWRALPDFVIVGAQKAGTTTLYTQLVAHPSVLAALRKEVHFFDRTPRALAWYRAFFPHRARIASVQRRTGAGVTGEATPFYLCHPAVPARLAAVVPDVRVIAVLRDPVARAISGYHHVRRWGRETRPIEVALDPGAEEVPASPDDAAWYDSPTSPLRVRGYLARGRYAEQLDRWYARFPREQVLVLETGDLTSGVALARSLAHLGIAPTDGPPAADRNVGAYSPPASSLESTLRDYFRPHNERLFALLGTAYPWS
ncbi:MAG: hypothetical protein AMXMBFR46_03260 [Acidimicrobiia bacterium]